MTRRDDQEQSGRLREALDLWVEDARRLAAGTDAADTTRAVMARIAHDPTGRAYLPERAGFGYAAAAAALLAVGLGGAWYVGERPASPQLLGVASALEQDGLAVLRLVELEQLAVKGR